VELITGGDTQNPTGTSVEHADNTLVTIGHLVPDVTTDSTETHEADSAPPGTASQRPSRKRTVSESAFCTHFLEYKLQRLEDAGAFQRICREDHAGQPAQILALRTDSSKLRAVMPDLQAQPFNDRATSFLNYLAAGHSQHN
jgi:hypothetical protein